MPDEILPGIALALLILQFSSIADDDKPTGPNSGTAPENRGVTGWNGGARDQNTEEDPIVEAAAAANQPWMAEGIDLQGTARQFSPKKTVE
jgi:hypothetical protein